jgi:opacity protein-like surface antigen
MRKAIRTGLKATFAVVAGMSLCVPAAQAAGRGNNGAGSMEFNVPLNYMSSASVNGDGGSSASVNAALGTGFGMGYNFSDNLQVNGQFTWSSRNYRATVLDGGGAPVDYSNTLYTSTVLLNAVYYFMPGDFTPFVSGGIGTTFTDSNIIDPGGGSGCYVYPIYGYMCYTPTKTSTNLSYNYGVGVRKDVNRGFALEGSWNQIYIDTAQSKDLKTDIWRVNFIFRM